MTEQASRIRKFTLIITAYPIALIALGLGLNVFVFGVDPAIAALPAPEIIWPLILAGILLVFNHTWLMTATELTRLNHNMYASPEEWAENNASKADVSPQGWAELERHQNAHRNATENTVYFAFLALLMAIVTPSILAAQTFMIGFAIARLGYTYSALRGKSALRGIFMSLSLLSIYGIAGYLVLSVLM